MTIKFRGHVYLLNKNDLKMANMFLQLANFAENGLTVISPDVDPEEIVAKMREYYDTAARYLGFKSMRCLLDYQAKWGTDIVHNINERALE